MFMDLITDVIKAPRRGKQPEICSEDGIFLLLQLYHTGCTLESLSTQYSIPSTTLKAVIVRARNTLGEILDERWKEAMLRPQVLSAQTELLKYVALIVDCTSIKILKPGTDNATALQFWDGKNKIFALKKESKIYILRTSSRLKLFRHSCNLCCTTSLCLVFFKSSSWIKT